MQILICSIRAEHEGDWDLHLSSQLAMTPYFFTTDHHNYVRWMPIYLLDMTQLLQDVHNSFQDGQFTIRRTVGSFNGILSNMGTESTVINNAKSDGSIIGLTINESALLRWTLTHGILGEYARAMTESSGLSPTQYADHEQTQPAAMKRDEQHLQ